jgi:hypothetical protein
MHLLALHQDGSNNPEGIASSSDRIRFHPYFSLKDLVGSTSKEPFPTVGIIHPKASNAKKVLQWDQTKRILNLFLFLFLAMLAGLIDGDGYFRIVKGIEVL